MGASSLRTWLWLGGALLASAQTHSFNADVTIVPATSTSFLRVIATNPTGVPGLQAGTIPSVPAGQPSVVPVDNSTSGASRQDPDAPHGANNRGNWIPGYNINTDYGSKWPTTGRTVRYTLRVQNVTLAPEGVPRQVLAVNGQYPGPTIEANWGDYMEITVINELQHNGTSMHWHGFRQLGTNLADGVNGVTECPIAPGDRKVYRMQATQYGTTWYHSHFSTQYGDGVVGPMVIHGPASANYDTDLGPVVASDMYPGTAPQTYYIAQRRGPQTSVNYFLNGQNVKVNGTSGNRTKWTFEPGKKHLLRLINSAADSHYKFQIDGHRFQVIAADFVPIIPYYTNELSVAIGQRYDVIVEANQAPGNYWFRAIAARECTRSLNLGLGKENGIISYSNAPSANDLPTTTNYPHTDGCIDEFDSNLVPVVQHSVDSAAFRTAVQSLPVDAQLVVDASNTTLFQWNIGGVSQWIDWGNPTMANAAIYNNRYSVPKNVVTLKEANKWVYFIVQNRFFVPHPMHVHGHDFAILGQGNGVFNVTTDYSRLNFVNPPRRDVVNLVSSGWHVIAFQTDNPGAWLFHCHIAWHVGEGLSLQFLERPVDIPPRYFLGVSMTEFGSTCSNWRRYAQTAVWEQHDSGLKRRDNDGALLEERRDDIL